MAERTGLEPATPGVTGRYSNQLNYRSFSITPWRTTKIGRLAMTYSHMGRPHTTIGAIAFHF